jgi:benzodiazapine receptor
MAYAASAGPTDLVASKWTAGLYVQARENGSMTMTSQPMPSDAPKGWVSLAVSICIVAGVAVIGGLATASSVTSWYVGLNKPSFNPPNWVFGPAWTALYILMAVAAWRVWRRGAGRASAALGLYAVQLALNGAWSVIFFGLRQPALALADISALLVLILAAAVAFWRIDRGAGLMMIPYIAWVSFALALNLEIWRLN